MIYWFVVIDLKSNMYEIEKNVEKILSGKATGFLIPSVCNEVKNRLRKNEYQRFSPYEDAEKVILYGGDIPRVKLYRIECDGKIGHSDVLGSLFGLNIQPEVFGDIIFWDGFFYVYLLEEISDFVWNNLRMVGNFRVQLVEVSLEEMKHYKREYEKLEFVVSSLRIDTILARLIGMNRDKIQEKIRDKQVLLNYEVLVRASSVISPGDVFSIKKYGKYRFEGIVGHTKKDNYVVSLEKYK